VVKRTCPNGHVVKDNNAAYCPRCGTKLPPPPPKQNKAMLRAITLGFIVLCGGMLVLLFLSIEDHEPASRRLLQYPTRTIRASSQAAIGDEVRLHWGVEKVFVAVDLDAESELSKVASSKDSMGMQILLASGRVFIVDDGTKVLVIDRALFLVKVRILEGPHAWQSGWVVHEAVD